LDAEEEDDDEGEDDEEDEDDDRERDREDEGECVCEEEDDKGLDPPLLPPDFIKVDRSRCQHRWYSPFIIRDCPINSRSASLLLLLPPGRPSGDPPPVVSMSSCATCYTICASPSPSSLPSLSPMSCSEDHLLDLSRPRTVASEIDLRKARRSTSPRLVILHRG